MSSAEGLTGVPVAPATDQTVERKPPAGVKFFYSLGQVVESSYLAVNAFVFFYYTAVLGLSGTLVGAALAISMCLDAAADPLIGAWSDNVRSRFGRRLPVMLVGAPLTMLTMGLLFSPPSGLSPFLLFLWLTFTKMTVRAFASMFNIPYFALGGELSDGYVERARIVAYRLLSGIVVSVAITAVAYSVFFAGEGGLQRPERYPAFGWSIAAAMLVLGLVSCAGIWRYAAALPQPTDTPGPMLRRLPGDIAELFRNPSFRVLFGSMLIFASAAGVNAALNAHVYVFVWKLRPETIQIMAYALLAGITAGIPATPPLLRRLEKKTVVLIGFAIVIVSWMALPLAWVLGVFTPAGAEAVPWLSATMLVVGLGTGLIYIAYPSMMADAADEHEHRYDARREGLYFSGLGFAGKAAAGVGTLLGGFALDLMRFPRELGREVNAVLPQDVLSGLILSWGVLPAILSLLGVIVFLPYGITRRRHDEIAADLRARRAAAAAAE